MMKKLVCTLLCLTLALAGLSGCRQPVPDTPETLEVYVFDAGYGTQWCADMLELFQSQPWVKEKYPELTVVFSHNDVSSFAESSLNSGRRANTIDLIFGTALESFAGPNGDLEDLTDSVYNALVPGEDITWVEKSLDSYNDSNRYIDVTNLDGEPRWYLTSWAGGMDTFLYNETILQSFGIDVPNTTQEMLDACIAIMNNKDSANGRYNEGYSFIQSKEADYWSYLFPIWWAQYEGVARYLDFWNGIDDNRYSSNIFRQTGRVESLEVYRQLLDYSKGYLAPASFTYEFMQAQTSFLQGHGVFHVNGDWFDNEMRAISQEIQQAGTMDTFKTMKMPIISALGNKLGITDATLSAVVDYVDGTTTTEPAITSSTGYTAADVIAAVREARTVVHSIGPNHNAVVPSYANGKAVAIDFLRFMATDIANESYIRTTGGASLPFHYDVKAKNMALYETMTPLQQSRHDYFSSTQYDVYTLPSDNAFPLSRYGGLAAFNDSAYYTTFAANGNTKTPQDFYDETISAWTQSKWEMALASAGIAT